MEPAQRSEETMIADEPDETLGGTADADHQARLDDSRDWVLTVLLFGLIAVLLICTALGLIAWDRAPVGATG